MISNKPIERSGNLGGRREGAGRPEGSYNKLAREAREQAKATGLLPHEILLSMARGEPQYEIRVDPLSGKATQVQVSLDIDQRRDAAKAGAPYYAPKISTVEVIRGVEDEQLDTIIAELLAQLAQETSADPGAGREEPPSQDPPATRTRVRITAK